MPLSRGKGETYCLRAEKCIAQVINAVSKWISFAEEADLSLKNAERIQKSFNFVL